MCQWLMAKFYDKIMHDAEEKGLRDWRRNLLHPIKGDVLELGCGTGVNLEFYPDLIKRLVLIEPNAYMCQQLKDKIIARKQFIEVFNTKAECLTLPDASFDAVVCTLVLCSVRDADKTLAEIHRVLRPEGKLFFIEHVAAQPDSKRYQWQRRLSLLWQFINAGCHITRDTENAIMHAGFQIVEIQRQSMRGVPAIVRPSIRGMAVKML